MSVLLVLAIGLTARAQDTTITVISNPKGAPSSMRMAELKSVFKGERQRWSDGTKVTIVMMKTTTPIGRNTCSKIYEMSSEAVKRFLVGLQFAGKGDPPVVFNSIQDLEDYVADNPGAIGVTGKFSVGSNIKVVSINGKNSF